MRLSPCFAKQSGTTPAHYFAERKTAAVSPALAPCRQQRHYHIADGHRIPCAAIALDHAVADIPPVGGWPDGRQGSRCLNRPGRAGSSPDLLRNVIIERCPSARATARPSRRYASPSALISSRENIPARRLASTISPATAFCSSLRPGDSGEISRQLNRHSVCPATSTTLVLPGGTSGSVRRGFGAQPDGGIRPRCAGNQTTDGSTVAPLTHGSTGLSAHAVLQDADHCGFHRTGAQPPGAVVAFCVVFVTPQKPDRRDA